MACWLVGSNRRSAFEPPNSAVQGGYPPDVAFDASSNEILATTSDVRGRWIGNRGSITDITLNVLKMKPGGSRIFNFTNPKAAGTSTRNPALPVVHETDAASEKDKDASSDPVPAPAYTAGFHGNEQAPVSTSLAHERYHQQQRPMSSRDLSSTVDEAGPGDITESVSSRLPPPRVSPRDQIPPAEESQVVVVKPLAFTEGEEEDLAAMMMSLAHGLQQRSEERDRDVASSRDELVRAKRTIIKQGKLIERLNEQSRVIMSAVTGQREKLLQSRDSIDAVKETCKLYQMTIVKLGKNLEIAEKEKGKINRRLDRAIAEHETLRNEAAARAASAESQIESLTSTHETISRQLSAAAERNAAELALQRTSMEQIIASLTKERESAHATIVSLRSEIKLNQELAEASLATAKSKIATLEEQFEEAKIEHLRAAAALERNCESAIEEGAALTKKIATLECEHSSSEERLRGDVAKLVKRCEEEEEKLLDVQRRLEAEINESKQNIELWTRKFRETDEERIASIRHLERARCENVDLERRLAESEACFMKLSQEHKESLAENHQEIEGILRRERLAEEENSRALQEREERMRRAEESHRADKEEQEAKFRSTVRKLDEMEARAITAEASSALAQANVCAARDDAMSRISSLEKSLAEAQSSYVAANDVIINLRSSLAKTVESRDNATETVAHLRSSLAEAVAYLDAAKVTEEQLRSSYAEMVASRDAAIESASQLRSSLAETKFAVDAATEIIAARDSSLAEALAALTAATETAASHEASLARTVEARDIALASLKEAQVELEDTRLRLVGAQSGIEDLTKALKDALEVHQRDLQIAAARSTDDLSRIETEKISLMQGMEGLRQEFASLKAESGRNSDEWTHKVTAFEAAARRREAELTNAKAKADSVRAALDRERLESKETLSKLAADLKVATEDRMQFETDLAASRRERGILLERVAELERVKEEEGRISAERVKTLTREIEREKVQIKGLLAATETAVKENEGLRRQVEGLRTAADGAAIAAAARESPAAVHRKARESQPLRPSASLFAIIEHEREIEDDGETPGAEDLDGIIHAVEALEAPPVTYRDSRGRPDLGTTPPNVDGDSERSTPRLEASRASELVPATASSKSASNKRKHEESSVATAAEHEDLARPTHQKKRTVASASAARSASATPLPSEPKTRAATRKASRPAPSAIKERPPTRAKAGSRAKETAKNTVASPKATKSQRNDETASSSTFVTIKHRTVQKVYHSTSAPSRGSRQLGHPTEVVNPDFFEAEPTWAKK
ncbi:hypothetical protein BDK51DRAFT_31243 [Blyttiomyces helicus]|uniref:Uncharacterized protein n=1 Tax=Blyttiomyces helicus TaxID=388810 RepID=A0A4P9WGD0_9FUNG|nr:hypothetical protein BDK51DRAFT_31243 [Blyttiomyces helicus]|eukprot:RKO90965.1 hypothetical protein BDK51DRAFT_31243 [Blyttiomyces helicus]